jgi:hypothetical protein
MDLMTPIYILGNRHFKIKRLIGQKAEAEGVNRWAGPHAWGGGGGVSVRQRIGDHWAAQIFHIMSLNECGSCYLFA